MKKYFVAAYHAMVITFLAHILAKQYNQPTPWWFWLIMVIVVNGAYLWFEED